MASSKISPKRTIIGEHTEKEKKYWLAKLDGFSEKTAFPSDFNKAGNNEFSLESYTCTFPPELVVRLNKLSNNSDSLLHIILIAGVNLLLNKYTGKTDLVTSTPVYRDVEGSFINKVLPLRVQLDTAAGFKDLLRSVRQVMTEASKHQNFPMELLPELLQIPWDDKDNFPISEIAILLENVQDSLDLEMFRHNIIFSFLKTEKDIILNIQYNENLYGEKNIERMAVHLETVLNEASKEVTLPIRTVKIISEQERNQILLDFNSDQNHVLKLKTLVELFEKQVEETPDTLALVSETVSYTYRELNGLANQLAHYLIDRHHVKPDDLLGLMVDHSEKMIIGILGVVKSGAAYVPIDPDFPEERVQFILKDTAAKIMIKSQKQAGHFTAKAKAHQEMILEDAWGDITLRSKANPRRINKPKDLAYVMYTSGSTGSPKGVMVEHKSVVRLVKNTNYINITPDDKMLQAAPFSFDASTFEIWGALLNGACLYTVRKENILDPEDFKTILKDSRISICWLTASLFNSFADYEPDLFSGLRVLLVGGEALSSVHINAVRKANKDLELINGYGPTENTTFSLCFSVKKEYDTSVPIGKPITNTSCYILNEDLELQPVGVPGELFVSGEGVARGYLGDKELTGKKFIDNPFVPGERMYRTGDLAKWYPDGTVEFLGRKDEQVKIRGYRIELQEIKYHLLQIEGIREAVVVAKEEDGKKDKDLYAYMVSVSNIDAAFIRNALEKVLPGYMIPVYFIFLDKLPLTANGKVNINALPAPLVNAEPIKPENEVEEKLLEIWHQVLGIEKDLIGTNTNFFTVGGNSLKASQMIAKVHKELNVKLPLSTIFEYTTVKAISAQIQSTVQEKHDAISKAAEKKFYPLSSAQKRLYFLQQLEVESTGYNLPSLLILEGEVDKDKLEATFKKLIERHESLRTSFESVLGQIFQKVHKEVVFHIEYEEMKAGEQSNEVLKTFVKPFNLAKAPLIRVGLKEMEKNKHILMVDMHHIISDGISEDVFIREFMSIYGGQDLVPNKLQYKDFSEWKNSNAQKEANKKHEVYWLNEFSDEVPVLDLPTDFSRPAVQNFEGDVLHFTIPAEEIDSLKSFSLREGVTLYMTLLSVFNILLSKLSRQDDILIGTPVAGRPHADLGQVIGVFVNTLVMRNFPRNEKTFREFLREVKTRTVEAFENQDYQFEDLVEKVGVARDTSRNPLFNVMFNMHNIGTAELQIPGLKLIPLKEENKISKFDLSIDILETSQTLSFAFEYATKLFKRETIERFAGYFKTILSAVITRPAIKISDIDLLTEKEEKQILFSFNGKTIDCPGNKTIAELFEAQVLRSPESVAVEFEGCQLSYASLNTRCNQLGKLLRQKGVKAGTIVGLMVERSLELGIGVMGIVKAGGAYLPVDVNYPEVRKKYMLLDSGASLILTQKHLLEASPGLVNEIPREKIICIDDESIYTNDIPDLELINKPNDLVYVIYTSGTTGEAKGIMIEHRNLVTYLHSFYDIFNQTSDDVVIQITSISFDIFAEQFFGTLLKGGKLVIPAEEAVKDIDRLAKIIRQQGITLVSCPPLILNELNKLKPFNSVRAFINGGDVLKPEYVSNLIKYSTVYNGYGPAETTVGATHHKYQGGLNANIPIGPPMSNYRIYITDDRENLLPVGVPGEICISGEAVGRGYINKPELTTRQFVPDPFQQGSRMYKTGDLGRWLADGTIEFIGRKDKQVKIRGYRIEMGEIEGQLVKIDGIKEAFVTAREDKKDKYLCAYYVADTQLEVIVMREQLSMVLPQYMIPAFFIRINEIPLTPNGKINWKALPEPTLKGGTNYVAPRNEREEELQHIWSGVLELDKDNISIDTDFFSVGGNSINATQLISKIQKTYHITMPLVEAFKAPTIMLQAAFIESLEKTTPPRVPGEVLEGKAAQEETTAGENEMTSHEKSPLEPSNVRTTHVTGPAQVLNDEKDIEVEVIPKQPFYKLSSGQYRMYVLNQLDKNSVNYNMFGAFEINGDLDRTHLKGVIDKLIRRHDSFRTSFQMMNSEMVQVIQDDIKFHIDYYDGIAENEVSGIIENFIRPFDLSKAPLFRVGLITLRAERYILLIDTHHIVSDGVSMQILIEEIVRLSQGDELPEQRFQYKDYAYWQQKRKQSDAFKAHERYWMQKLGNELPVLNMPGDYNRPGVKRSEGSIVEFELDEALTEKLKTLSNETKATVYMILLAAYNVLFHKYTGQEDIIVGSPVAVRPLAEFERILGVFANTVVMRNHPQGKKKFSEFLQEVKENTLGAITHDEYPFEELVERLNVKRDLSRNPIFDVMFASQNTGKNKKIDFQKLSVKPYPFPTTTSMFDILLNAVEVDNKISLSVIYSVSLFKHDTIRAFCNHYVQLIKQVTDNKDIAINKIELLSEDDKSNILEKFNDTDFSYTPVLIHNLFEKQAEKTPDNIAVTCEDRILSYGKLNEYSNAFADYLRKKLDVTPGDIVGIITERSEWMVVALLGILKAGAAYVPVEPGFPVERIKYIMDDAAVKLLITDKHRTIPEAFSTSVPILALQEDWDQIKAKPKRKIPKLNKPEDLAYVIYTSGSTGQPKGVEITHKNAVAFLLWAEQEFVSSDFATVLSGTSYCFDLSVFEIFHTLATGKSLRILGSNLEISKYLKKEEKILINTVPSVIDILLKSKADLSNVTVINMAGETVPPYFKKLLDYKQIEVRNLYGPSEDTTYTTCYRFSDDHTFIPIGKPIFNTRIYIVDEAMNLVPPGIMGEICISGDGLARGYLNNKELTNNVFISNPFDPGKRMYKTGDWGRWLRDGNIEFIGRKDQQVKIRGHRIELGEIEHVLRSNESVEQAIVTVSVSRDGEKYLTAYYVAKKDARHTDLKKYLQKQLPSYMIPANFFQLDQFPLTPNGKISRKNLPDPEALNSSVGEVYVAPDTDYEKRLVKIWEQILGHTQIGVDTSFFDMGGNSLKIIKMQKLVNQEFNVDFSIAKFFEFITIRDMAAVLEKENLPDKEKKTATAKEMDVINF